MKLLIGLMWLLHWLPLPLLARIGEALGALLFYLMPTRRRVALINLRLCMPELSAAKQRQLAHAHFRAYARAVLERGVLWWGSKQRLQRLIVIEPALPLDAMLAKPTILLCPHFVCLDVAGVAIALQTSACSIYTPQRNAEFDRALHRGRSRFHPVKILTRAAGIKPILRAMRDGLPFFMLPDLDFGLKDAEFVPFFGVPAATLTAPARIAAATGAQVIPVVATFLPNYRGWKVTFYPAWDNYPGDDIVAATRYMNQFIEQRVVDAPAEYWWTHKRFKTQRGGKTSPYRAQR